LHSIRTYNALESGRKEGLIFQNIKLYDFEDGIFLRTCNGCDNKGSHTTKGISFT